ncbi:MAG: ankyrin repeat domain-containing protein [Verrucomicrobia bacterium]|nr:ankyrin repeat domain-containing protein [Verrucomicrobiota bacterium]
MSVQQYTVPTAVTNIPPLDARQVQINDIASNCNVTVFFIAAIKRTIAACGPQLAAQIVKQGLEQAGKSIETEQYGNIFKALHRAAFEGCTEVVQLLLTFPNAHELAVMDDVDGFTGFLWAANNGHKDVVALFLSLPIASRLLAKKTSANATAAHYIAYNNHTEVMRLLLALPNAQELLMAQTIYGKSPLHEAACGGKKKIVELLLASLDAQKLASLTDISGNTAYDVATNHEIKNLLYPYQPYRCVQIANRSIDFLKFIATGPF